MSATTDAPNWKKGGRDASVRRITLISASTTTLDPPMDGILCDTDVTITCRGVNNGGGSNTVTLNLPAGYSEALVLDQVTSITGTAHALYHV